MRLTRIEIEGFGTLQGMELRFGPTMNLVVGPNEAGKSTLQEAIVTGLYGLQSGDRAHSALVERADRWRPWQGGNFGLALEVVLEDGTQLRVERDLDAETVRVFDVSTGAELGDRFDHDASGGLQVGRQLLGVSRDIYTNTACISRSEVQRLEDAGTIKEAIIALADSAHPDRTAQKVLDRLRQERTHRIGKPRGRSGPLHDLEARLTELERQLAAARQARAAVDELAQKRETVSALTEAELGIVQTLEAALLASRLQDAGHRLERVEALERAIAEERGRQQEHTRFAMFPLDRQAEVQELRSHLRATRETQADFERRAADSTAQVQQLDTERQKLESEAQGHQTRARGIDDVALAQEPTVRELLSTLNVADSQAPEVHLRAQTAAEDARRIAERHPGLIGNNLDWPARQMEFQRVFSEWRERHNVALEARRRAGAELPPRLERAPAAPGAAQARHRPLQGSPRRHQDRPASRGGDATRGSDGRAGSEPAAHLPRRHAGRPSADRDGDPGGVPGAARRHAAAPQWGGVLPARHGRPVDRHRHLGAGRGRSRSRSPPPCQGRGAHQTPRDPPALGGAELGRTPGGPGRAPAEGALRRHPPRTRSPGQRVGGTGAGCRARPARAGRLVGPSPAGAHRRGRGRDRARDRVARSGHARLERRQRAIAGGVPR
ncbi:MAG: hypothetical protein E6I47_02115 [Chloroflexi bacterium]|nr:MAG: hypothetical protein E6I47_02115 [Chloroflexota bacterium]